MTTIQRSFNQARTNRERLLSYLLKHGSITPMRALHEWGETRLAARILELRGEGWGITTWMRSAENGGKYAEYKFTGRQKEFNEWLRSQHGASPAPVYSGSAPQHSRFQHRHSEPAQATA